MREYDSVTQAVTGISDRLIDDFAPTEAKGMLRIVRDDTKIADLRYAIRMECGKRRLDYAMKPCAKAGMEQSLGILAKVADESSPWQRLAFEARNMQGREKRDFYLASYKEVECKLDVHSSDETLGLAAVLLGFNPKELRTEVDASAQAHIRQMPKWIGPRHVSQMVYGKNGFMKMNYWMDGGPERRIYDREFLLEARPDLGNRMIADELVKAFGKNQWHCHSDGTLSETEEDEPRLTVSFQDGPNVIFARPGPGASRLCSVPEIVSNQNSLTEIKIFDRILAEFEPFVKKE